METLLLDFDTPATIAPRYTPAPRQDLNAGGVRWLRSNAAGFTHWWRNLAADTTFGVSGGSTEFDYVAGVVKILTEFPWQEPIISGVWENSVHTIPVWDVWGAGRGLSQELRGEAIKFVAEQAFRYNRSEVFVSEFHREVVADVVVVKFEGGPHVGPRFFFDTSGVAYEAPSGWRNTGIPQTVRWVYRNRGQVGDFLTSFPLLGALLPLLEESLKRLFGDEVEVVLEVVRLPEDEAKEELAVIVRSTLDIETGLEKLEQLEDAWLERGRSLSDGRFFFNIEFL